MSFVFVFPCTRLIKKEVCYICHPHLLQFLSTFTQVFSDKCEQQLDHPTKKLSTSNARQLISTNKQSLKIREMFNFSHLVSGIQQFLSLHYRPFIRAQCSIQMLHFKAFLKPEINYMIRQSKECLDWNVEIVLLLLLCSYICNIRRKNNHKALESYIEYFKSSIVPCYKYYILHQVNR